MLGYRQLRRCNSTTLLTNSQSSVYALGFVLASSHLDPDVYYSSADDSDDQQRVMPGPAPAPFTAACPAHFSALFLDCTNVLEMTKTPVMYETLLSALSFCT